MMKNYLFFVEKLKILEELDSKVLDLLVDKAYAEGKCSKALAMKCCGGLVFVLKWKYPFSHYVDT